MTVTPQETPRTARAAEALAARHSELQGVLDHWAGVLAAADSGRPVRPVRNLLRAFLTDEVLPHARAEERTLYRAARRAPDTSLLVRELIAEHKTLASMAGEFGDPASPAATAARAAAVSALFASHVAKEDSVLLPALRRAGTDLAALCAREPLLTGSPCAA